jgi:hypothetical protein
VVTDIREVPEKWQEALPNRVLVREITAVYRQIVINQAKIA